MSDKEVNEVESKEVEKPSEKKEEEQSFTKSQLDSLLTQRQKKQLGLLPKKFLSDAAKARNEALRQRMLAINEERRKIKEQKELEHKPKKKEHKVEKSHEESPVKPVKRKVVEPSESDSDDPYIQKKAKKVSQTMKQLTKVEEYIQKLKQSNEHNPYFRLLMK